MNTPGNSSDIYATAPYLIVEDVNRSAEYYRDILGFRYDQLWGEPPSFVIARRGNGLLMLRSSAVKHHARPNNAVDADFLWDAYFYVSDIEALHKEFTANGAEVLYPPSTKFYGMREMEVRDINGYILCFGQDAGTPEQLSD